MIGIGSGRVRARGSVRCDTEATNRVDFLPGERIDIAMDEAPLLAGTVEVTKEGRCAMDAVEYSMMVDVACDFQNLSGESASNSQRTDMGGSGPDSDIDVAGVASGEYEGCRDVESLTPSHQILPYGSQLRDMASSAGHEWVNADIRDDDQVSDAVAQAEATIRRHAGAQPLVLSAYSDGSVAGRGVAGSAAIVIETTNGEVVATSRLAPTDVALSSGRTEWVGLVMVLIAAASPSAKIELRLDNIQVANTFNDGRRKYVRDWLKRTHRRSRCGVAGLVTCGGT